MERGKGCRLCRRADVPMAPFGYCPLCSSRFGSTTQVAMLALAHNPSLTEEQLQQTLGSTPREVVHILWTGAHALVEAWTSSEARHR